MNFLKKEISLSIVSSEYSVILEYFKSSLTTDDKLGRKFNSPNDKWKKPNKNVININMRLSTVVIKQKMIGEIIKCVFDDSCVKFKTAPILI